MSTGAVTLSTPPAHLRWRTVALCGQHEANVCPNRMRVQGTPSSPARETDSGTRHHGPLGRGRIHGSTAEHPPTMYDYSGFPEHTYHIKYPAPGSSELAARVQQLLSRIGEPVAEDPQRGFDHGTFVPLVLMYPAADVPVVIAISEVDLRSRRAHSHRTSAGSSARRGCVDHGQRDDLSQHGRHGPQ
jgi:hypothetical protein